MSHQAIILKNGRIADLYYKMKLSCNEAVNASAGQFMMIKVSPHYDPFLRRPMSFYKINKREGSFEILYQVVGKGTEIMSELKEGDRLDILAPLGKGFSIPEKMERAILVAGGIGVAPMVALAEEIRSRSQKSEVRSQNHISNLSVFIGGKTKNDILCVEDFERIGADVHIATEDGSMGKKATCVDVFKEWITNLQSSIIFACGPHGMLKATADISINKNMLCQVSLDKRMACGTGACLGCVVKVRSQGHPSSGWVAGVRSQKSISQLTTPNSQIYKCVCKDGPVFDAREINWETI